MRHVDEGTPIGREKSKAVGRGAGATISVVRSLGIDPKHAEDTVANIKKAAKKEGGQAVRTGKLKTKIKAKRGVKGAWKRLPDWTEYRRIGFTLAECMNLLEGGFVKAAKNIEKKGTEGKFTEYCGGDVTDACIKGALAKGGHPAKMAQFAKAARSVAKKRTDEQVFYTQSKGQKSTGGVAFERKEGQKTSSKRFQAGMSPAQKAQAALKLRTRQTQAGKRV